MRRWDHGYQPRGPRLDPNKAPQGGCAFSTPNSELRTHNSLDLTPHSELRSPNYSTIKTTPEQIVRDYRNSIKHREGPILGSIESLMIERQVHVQAPKKSIIRKFIDRINWGMVFDLVCIVLAGLTITYIFGFIVFGPFKK
jgi:hypothetical protein